MSDMWEYEPGVVYENLIIMVTKYRGATLTKPALTKPEVQLRMNQHGYTTIMATRDADPSDPRGSASLYVVLIAPGNDYANKSPKFKNLLATIPPSPTNEIIMVTEHGITTHIKKVIDEYNNRDDTGLLLEYDYHLFIIETPLHNSCEHHEILPYATVDEHCYTRYISKEEYPKIKSTEAHAVWLGVRPGMTVKVTRASKSAGVSIIYRLCAK